MYCLWLAARRNQGKKDMEIFDLEGMEMDRESRTRERVRLLKGKVERLKGICDSLYREHSYHAKSMSDEEYRKSWKDARRLCAEIERSAWSESKAEMEPYKALAGYYLGTVYKERGDYDVALSYLKRVRALIEEQSAQYILTECYVGSCIGMAKCYIEKHSSAEVIDECHNCANEVLDDKYSGSSGRNLRYRRLFLELRLQQAIAELDMYGQKKVFDGKRTKVLLREAEEELKKIRTDKKREEVDPEWEKKQEITLITTKGDYYKKLYFSLSDASALKREDDFYHDVWIQTKDAAQKGGGSYKGNRNHMKKQFFEAAFRQFAEVIEKEEENTICLGNIAALLYDYYDKTKDDGYLFGLLENCFKKTKGSFGNTIPEVINSFLDRTLEIEYNNMFALNLKVELAEGERDKEEGKHYPALRQSSLKRRFKDLRNAVGEVCLDEQKSIMMNLTLLHNRASEFMDAAIIDFTHPDWMNLTVGHYTRLSVLPKLINKDAASRLRIQNVHHLNDPLEGVLFVDFLKHQLKEERTAEGSLIRKLMELYSSEKNGTVRNSVYMGSFTSRLDQLNMWSQYGDGGKGCSLQINAAKTFDSSASVSLAEISGDESEYVFKMEDSRYPLYMVIYLPAGEEESLTEIQKYAKKRAHTDKKESKWWEMQAALIGKLGKLEEETVIILKEIEKDFGKISKVLDEERCEKTKRELCNTIMVILDLVRFLIKSDYYSDEREYRIIQYSSDPEYDNVDDGIPKLYIQMEKELVYKEICFGPLVQNYDSLAAYVLNIRKEGEEGTVRKTWELNVRKSDIDFR